MDSRLYSAWFDGSTNHKTKRSGIGGYILSPTNEIVNKFNIEIPYEADSRVVEYIALIELSNRLLNRKILNVEIHSDFKGLCDSINYGGSNKYNKLSPATRVTQLHQTAKELLYCLTYYMLTWVPRKNNQIADELSKKSEVALSRSKRKLVINDKARELYKRNCPKSAKRCNSIEELDFKIQRCIDLSYHLKTKENGTQLYHYFNNIFYVKEYEIVDIQKSKSSFFVSEEKREEYYNKNYAMA